MNGQNERYFEAKHLLQLLAAVINQQRIPRADHMLDWGLICQIAEYNHVSNDVYYAVLGMDPPIPDEWMKRFSRRFHLNVRNEESYKNVIEAVLWQCETYGLHVLPLESCFMSEYYPRPEMRMIDRVEFVIEQGKRDTIGRLMQDMNFSAMHRMDENLGLFYSREGLYVVFHEGIESAGSKMKRYYGRPLKKLPVAEGKQYIHQLELSDSYVFMVGRMAQAYAENVLDIRAMMDLWLFYAAKYQQFNWGIIRNGFKKLGIGDFSEKLVRLAALWFGGIPIYEEEYIYEDMESYIITRGLEGREMSKVLLPLIGKVERLRERSRRKEERHRKWIEFRCRWVKRKEAFMAVYRKITGAVGAFFGKIGRGIGKIFHAIAGVFKWIGRGVGRFFSIFRRKKDNQAER